MELREKNIIPVFLEADLAGKTDESVVTLPGGRDDGRGPSGGGKSLRR